MSPFIRNVIKNLLKEIKELKSQISSQHDYEDLKSLGVNSRYFASPDGLDSVCSYWNNEDNDKRDEFVVNHRWLDDNKKDTN